MLIHDLVQGSPEWVSHRAQYKNASDTPVIMGLSKYKTRTQYLNERKSGIVADVDSSTQRRFDDGHRYEALARPVAEKIVGTSLYPVTGSEGEFGASFDGIDINEEIDFEHKSLNDELRSVKSISDLGEEYLVQMEHQLMVCNGKKALFMASKWDANNELVEEIHFWYEPDAERRQRILDAWAQIDIDLENHVVVEVVEKPKSQPVIALPSLAIQIKGEVTLSNLPEFKTAATAFIATIKTELVTDEDFVNGEANIKRCEDAEEHIELTKAAAISQTVSIDELMRTLDFIKEQLRDKRLLLKKLVVSEKEKRKAQIVEDARNAFTAHMASHLPTRLQAIIPDFALATRNKKTLTSMKESVNQLLVNSKIEIDVLARDIKRKNDWFNDIAKGYTALFPDLQTIIYKANEDFQLLVNSRIAEHREAEEKKAEKIRLDAETALLAKQAAEKVAEIAIEQQPEIIQEQVKSVVNSGLSVSQANVGLGGDLQLKHIHTSEIRTQYFAGATPTVNEIVTALAIAFKVDELQAHKYLIDADFTKWVAEKKAA